MLLQLQSFFSLPLFVFVYSLHKSTMGTSCQLRIGSVVYYHMSPASKIIVVQVKPMLLRTNNHSWSDHSHVRDTFVGCKSMSVYEMGSIKQPVLPNPCFTMYNFSTFIDNTLCSTNKFFFQSRTSSIIENHINVLDISLCKLFCVV